jgi:hypothetical protein
VPEDGRSRGQAAGSGSGEARGHGADMGRHSFAEIVDRLLYILVLRSADSKFRYGGRKIVSRPMMPCARGCIGIVAEQDKTPRSGRHVRPLQRRGRVLSITGKAPRNCCSVGEGA